MKLARIVTAISAVVFIGLGVTFLLVPAKLGDLIGLAANTPTAMTDIRATYGGFELGVGVFLAFCLVRKSWLAAALLLQAMTLAGFASGRVLGIASDGPQQVITYVAFTTEVAGVALALVALARLGREQRAAGKSDVEDLSV